MKDKWMNIGCEDDELKPYVEPEQDFIDPKRVEILISSTCCTKEEIDDSLRNKRYDDLMAYYLLLHRRTQEVSNTYPIMSANLPVFFFQSNINIHSSECVLKMFTRLKLESMLSRSYKLPH